jgi:hypothetical protein
MQSVESDISRESESLGLRTSSIIWNSNKLKSTVFQKLDLFLSLGKDGEMPGLFGPLEKANLSHCTNDLKKEQIQFLKHCFLVCYSLRRWTRFSNPVILSVMQHYQKPSHFVSGDCIASMHALCFMQVSFFACFFDLENGSDMSFKMC